MEESVVVLYYETILQLCDICGDCNMYAYPYNDLKSSSPSPNSYRTLVNSYKGDINYLGKLVSDAEKKRAEIGQSATVLAKALGLYPKDMIIGESEKVIAFCDKIMMRDEDCDFRKFVRKWTITQRDRIRDKKSYIVMSYDYYVDRYAKLLDKRKEKKKAKVKAAANTAKTNLKSPD